MAPAANGSRCFAVWPWQRYLARRSRDISHLGGRRAYSARMGRLLFGALIAIGAGGFGGCGSNPSVPGPRPLPTLALGGAAPYFTVDGTPRVVMSRNITGTSVGAIEQLIDQASGAGDTLIRLHVIQGLGAGVASGGAVDPEWAASWDQVFDHAAQAGLYVAPVFAVWADWNDGTPDYGFANWAMNPWNSANGGPATDPSELWQAGTAVREGWMAWLGALVDRWQGRPNIAAWEVFSELDIATGADETSGAAFAAEAAGVVRGKDAGQRPVMASLTALNDWPALNSSDAVDILQIHGYADPLDTYLINHVGALLNEYGKPVLIGESGLSAAAPTGGTATTEPNAALDVRHAIWAGVVSGAINARGLWWEDGYAVYEPPGVAFVNSYADAESRAATFVGQLDFTGVTPLAVSLSADLVGGAVGSAARIIGWVRSGACTAPAAACDRPLTGETIGISLPGAASTWTATFFDTSTGHRMSSAGTATGDGESVTLMLPTFSDDLAFVLVPSAA